MAPGHPHIPSPLCLAPGAADAHRVGSRPRRDTPATTASQIPAYIRAYAPWEAAKLTELPEAILDAATAHDLAPMILAALIKTEHTFDRSAVSTAGAMGLPQFLSATILMRRVSIGQYQRSIRVQVNLAARYLRDLTVRYGSQDLALLAYNGNLTPSQARYVMRVHRIH